MKPRVGILISGRGSNMQALIRAAERDDYPAAIGLVLSNRSAAAGLDIARQHGVATRIIPSRDFRADRAAHEAVMNQALIDAGCTIVCLAGYMRLLTPYFVNLWAGRMLNIHPSLLPAFPGLDTHARALAAGSKIHGCTVHLVTETMDEGPILAQAAVPVLPDDTEATLNARVLAQEHWIYPIALGHHLGAVPVAAGSHGALVNPCA
jgi:phosphoribosylglycinamide formyltransferase-1